MLFFCISTDNKRNIKNFEKTKGFFLVCTEVTWDIYFLLLNHLAAEQL